MPRYIYTAKSQPNQTIQGDIEAESEQDAINKLSKMGYFPLSVQTKDASLDKQGIWHFRKITKREIAIFTRQLSSLIESGVNILKSLSILSNQTNNKSLKTILNDLISKIEDGKSLSESLSAHPKLFSSLYTSMVYSGEVGGNIELTLKRLADFLEKEEEFKGSIRQALVYPFFILAVSALTVIILLGFVIPRLVSMFEDMGQILPLPTQMLINLSGFLRNYWWVILAIILISIFLLRRIYLSPQGRVWLDRLKLRLSIWGIIVLKTEIGRLARTLSLLLSSGIPTVHSLDISASVLENQILKMEVQKFKNQIAGGLSFSKCLQESKLFPAFVTDIVRIGEETGTLEKSLMRIADSYEAETDRALKALTRLLEPVIILVMGLIVGFIVISMLLPIFQINLIVR
jgi:type II secretory pathway component PulF